MQRRDFISKSAMAAMAGFPIGNLRNTLSWFRSGKNTDVLAGAQAIYSTFRFRSAYAGNCMKITVAATTYDIGFVGNKIDATAIKALNSNNTVLTTVNKIYDQSGNGFDLTLEATYNEAILAYDSYMDNYYIQWLPANVGNAIVAISNSSYINASITVGSQAVSVYHVIRGKNNTIDASTTYWEFGASGSNDLLYFSTVAPDYNRSLYSTGGQKLGVANFWESVDAFGIHSLRSDGTSGKENVDNIFSTTCISPTNYTSTGIRLGRWSAGSGNFFTESDWCGTIVYGSTLSGGNDTSVVTTMLSALNKTVSHTELVTVVGDSLTAGYGLQRNQNWLFKLVQAYNNQSIRWINAGVGGTKITDINTDFNNRVGNYTTTPAFSSGPAKKIAILWAGTNDIRLASATGATAYGNFQTLAASCRTAGYTKLIGMDIIPRSDNTAQNNIDLAAFNTLFAADNSTFDAKVTLSGLTWGNPATQFTDGVHLNNAGTIQLYNALKPVLDTYI